jgi:hypothetical protein
MSSDSQQRLDRLYASSKRAGFLHECIWSPKDGQPVAAYVNYAAPGERRFDGIAIVVAVTVKFPTHWFVGIKKGDGMAVAGGNYKVTEVVPLGDGSETEVSLQRRS